MDKSKLVDSMDTLNGLEVAKKFAASRVESMYDVEFLGSLPDHLKVVFNYVQEHIRLMDSCTFATDMQYENSTMGHFNLNGADLTLLEMTFRRLGFSVIQGNKDQRSIIGGRVITGASWMTVYVDYAMLAALKTLAE